MIWAAFQMNLADLTRKRGLVSVFVASLPQALTIALLVRGLSDTQALDRLLIGQVLLGAWTVTALWGCWLLADEVNAGTLEMIRVTDARIADVLLGRLLALVLFGFGAGGLASGLMAVVSGHTLSLSLGFVALVVAVILGTLALSLTCLVLSLSAGLSSSARAFTNALIPIGIISSGFFFPVSTLPRVVAWVCRLLPTAWVMQVATSIIHADPVQSTLWNILGFLLSSIGFAVLAKMLARRLYSRLGEGVIVI